MDEIDLPAGVDKALDALFADRLALLCGAGLSMAAPSSLPSAAALAWRAKEKYDATYVPDRAPLPELIDDIIVRVPAPNTFTLFRLSTMDSSNTWGDGSPSRKPTRPDC
jgi:hypothetical protein